MNPEYERPLWVQISLEVVLAEMTAIFAWYMDPLVFGIGAFITIFGRSFFLDRPPKLALRLRYPIDHWWPTKMGLRVLSLAMLSGGTALALTRDPLLGLACFALFVVYQVMLPESADDEESEPAK